MVSEDGDLLDELFDQSLIKLCDIGFLSGDKVLQLLDPVHSFFPVVAVDLGLLLLVAEPENLVGDGIVTALQWTSIILWITNGLWWLFAIWACVAIPWGIAVSIYYFKHIAYICPECHEVFSPRFKDVFWAYHTPKMRRLTCPKCGHKGLCIEVYAEKDGANNV